MKLISVLFIPILLSACATEFNAEYETTIVPGSLSVPDTLYEDQLGTIYFSAYGINSCARYARYESTPTGNSTYFKFYCYKTEGNCFTAMIEIDTSIVYSFSRPGWNYLYFKISNDSLAIDSVFIRER